MDFRANEVLQLTFTLEEEVVPDPSELVRPGFRHFERELPDVFAVDQMKGCAAHTFSESAALNFNCATMHSVASTSVRGPRYTG